MSWQRYRYYDFFPRSTPKKAKGGIKAQSKRGTFGQSWWAKRWIAVLESFHIGARLGRGRSYAPSGQGLSIEIHKGHWLAVGEVDIRNTTDEITLSGYGARVVLLARPPGYGLTKNTAPDE